MSYYLLAIGGTGNKILEALVYACAADALLGAGHILAERFDVAADVWSATSYKRLYEDALDAERWNRWHPAETPRQPYVSQALTGAPGPIIAASDYLHVLPGSLARWLPAPLTTLGTDGFGHSDGRPALRRFFEVDAESVAAATLTALAQAGSLPAKTAAAAIATLGLNPDKPSPRL